jgi:hypothetical protein
MDEEYMSFTVAFRVTDSNLRVFHHFKEFAKDKCNDNYLQTIRELLLKATILDKLIEGEKDGLEGKDRKLNKEELYS